MGIITSLIVVMVLIYVVGVIPAALAYIAIIALILPVFILVTVIHSIEESKRLKAISEETRRQLEKERNQDETELERILSLKEKKNEN